MLTTRNREAFLLTQTHSRRTKAIASPLPVELAPIEGINDPFHDLRCKREEARHVTSIHFGKKDLKAIHPNFHYFVNLESLWLNDNHLENVNGLFPKETDPMSTKSGCMRLRNLYLFNNNVATLGPDLQRLRFLEVLLLSGNKLSNMETVCQRLKSLRYLKHLDLFGNPLAEEKNYRQYFIVNLPSLEIFDRHVITERERAEAPSYFASREEKPAIPINRRAFRKLSPSVELLEARVNAIHKREKAEQERLATEDERAFRERYERRAAFHAKWPGKPWVPPATQRDISSLFSSTEKGTDDDTSYLIPERLDVKQTLPSKVTPESIEERYFPAAFTLMEVESLKNTLGTNIVLLEDAPNVLRLLNTPSSNVIDLKQYVTGSLGVGGKSSVDLRTMLLSLLRYPPFATARMLHLQQQAKDAMAEGNADAAMAFLKRYNVLQEVAVSFLSEIKPNVGNYFTKK